MGDKEISLYGCYITFLCAASRSQSGLGQSMSLLHVKVSKAAASVIPAVHVHTEMHGAVRSVLQAGLLSFGRCERFEIVHECGNCGKG